MDTDDGILNKLGTVVEPRGREMGRKLTAGQIYDLKELVFVGWSDCVVDGYLVDNYFDADGRYLGPDAYGIEPLFADDTGIATR